MQEWYTGEDLKPLVSCNIIYQAVSVPSLFKLIQEIHGLSSAFIAKPRKMGVTVLLLPVILPI